MANTARLRRASALFQKRYQVTVPKDNFLLEFSYTEEIIIYSVERMIKSESCLRIGRVVGEGASGHQQYGNKEPHAV